MNSDDIRNRFAFHPAPDDEKRNAHTAVRTQCLNAALYLNEMLPDGREKSLAITHLEEAMFWGNAALARPPL